MEESKITKSFCVLPWIHSFVNFNGGYQLCCTSEEYLTSIPDKNGTPFNIKSLPSLNEVMNAETYKNIRLNMLEGNWSGACTRCFESESMGGVSRRNIENEQYSHLIENLIKTTSENGEIQVECKSIDYRLGNLCNLKCRMCSPQSTNAWINEWNQAKPELEKITPAQRLEYENYDWIEKDFLLVEFKKKLAFAKHIHFAGGEPLITPQMAKMLQTCVDLGVSEEIILSYNTNLTKLPLNVLELWKNFKEVKILCSVDGFGEINNYIRHPSKWEVIDKNLMFIDQHAREYKISEIILSCTVQLLNVMNLAELYSYLKKFNNIIPALNLIPLHQPHYLQTTLLPAKAKTVATQRLLETAHDLENKLPFAYEYLRENIFQIINLMNSTDHSSQLSLFRKANADMDKIKNLSLFKSIPELNEILCEHYIKDL